IVESTEFLGVHLTEDLTWSLNTSSITKKAQQSLYFLRRLRKAHLPPPILTTFYRRTIESILSSCITAWFGNCTVSDRKTLQWIVRTAEKINGVSLPSIMDIYSTRCAALLPVSLNVSIQSENMRHILNWSSLQDACCSVNYTVRYQGEFEYMQNARWQDEPLCVNIVKTECDLTVALSSDSDYNISVLARCDDSTLWTQLPKSFNRRDTVLRAPKMDVHQKDGQIEVLFGELQNHIKINLKIWKEGDEQNASIKEITDQRFYYDVWQEGGGGGKYCLKAEAVLDLSNKRNSTEIGCVQIE
ncbi:hypothetical protein QTP86_014242, partial [Hemibagrus guttatus]